MFRYRANMCPTGQVRNRVQAVSDLLTNMWTMLFIVHGGIQCCDVCILICIVSVYNNTMMYIDFSLVCVLPVYKHTYVYMCMHSL